MIVAPMMAVRTAQFLGLGYVNFSNRAYRSRKRRFTPGALDVDLSGRSFLVTGANSGLGFAAAEALATRGAEVHMLCRSRERGERARDALRAAAPAGRLHLHLCDIGSLADVRRFAEEFKNESGDGGSPRKLDVLVNNAGLMAHTRVDTPDGFELNFGVNVLGTYVLTEMLMPCLEAAGDARVVTVSSGGMLLSGREALLDGTCYGNDLVTEPQMEGAPRKIDGQLAYSRNKRCQVALTEHWAATHAGSGVRFFAMHPGWASTEGLKSSMEDFHATFNSSLRTPEEGADTIVWLSVAEEVKKETNGDFFLDRISQPKHLWLAGTNYGAQDVSGLVSRLNSIAKQKAGIEIKSCDSST